MTKPARRLRGRRAGPSRPPSSRRAGGTRRRSSSHPPDPRRRVAVSSGTGKTHVALALGLAACQRGLSTLFVTAHGLSSQLMEARDEKRLLRLQARLQNAQLLIVDELGYVPLSQVGAELLFEVFSQRYERGSTIVTSNLPFAEWPSVFRSERLTGALLDRLTHHVHILETNGESYRLKQSAGRRRAAGAEQNKAAARPHPAAAPGKNDHDPGAANQPS